MSQLFISSKLLSPLMQRSNNTAIVFPKAILQSSQLLYQRQQFKKKLAQELQLKVVMHEVITTVEVCTLDKNIYYEEDNLARGSCITLTRIDLSSTLESKYS